jgi:hypothetical protein
VGESEMESWRNLERISKETKRGENSTEKRKWRKRKRKKGKIQEKRK